MLAQVEGLSVSITSGTTAWGALKLGKGKEGKGRENNTK
jgi:cysteine synthase